MQLEAKAGADFSSNGEAQASRTERQLVWDNKVASVTLHRRTRPIRHIRPLVPTSSLITRETTLSHLRPRLFTPTVNTAAVVETVEVAVVRKL